MRHRNFEQTFSEVGRIRMEFRPYHHAEAGFTLPIPADWDTSDEVEGCALVAAEPDDDPRHFLVNVVVTIETVESDDADQWAARSRDALTNGTLNRLRIVDIEETEIGGRRAWRTLSHYLHRTHGGVNLEQWAVVFGERGYVISSSMAALAYDDWADVMTSVAEGLKIDGESS